MKFYGKLGYHDYEGIALIESEKERLVRGFGPPQRDDSSQISGLIVGGNKVEDAFHEIYFLERACAEAQVAALAGGGPLNLPSEEVRRLTASQFNREESAEIRQLAWKAALSLIEGSGNDYRS